MSLLDTSSVTRHMGIRFATAGRFEPPVLQPFDPAAGTWDTPGKLAPQVPGMMETMLGIDVGDMSEDCLFLNVFAPAEATASSRLPVLYWIHGGAYLNGAGSIPWYDGSALAARGHVVVTINYRLGALGFLGGGNWGTLDQICGLRWVREHIASFGGDPDNVTIFGESAGGSAVVSLLAAETAVGLFHRAWAMSPSIGQLRSVEQANVWADAFLAHAGVANIAEARTLPLEKVLEAQSATLAMPNTNLDMFSPAGGGAALAADLLGAAAANPVPLSIGTNRDENLLFMAFDPRYSGAGEQQWVDHLALQFGDRAAEARAAYEAARDGANHLTLIGAAQTDHVFRQPARRLAEARHALDNDTWMYWFTWASPAFGGALGSAHALDIPFAFDNLQSPGTEMLLGDGPERQAIATRFADEISGFAKGGAASWPQYDLHARPTLRIDTDIEVLHDPEPGVRALFD